MSLNGVIRIPVASEPTITPPAGRLFIWVEHDTINNKMIYKYKDENGNVGLLSGQGGSSTRLITIQAGNSNLPRNGIETRYAYGHNNAEGGVVVKKAGKIIGITAVLNRTLSTGYVDFYVRVNTVNYTSTNHFTRINGSANVYGGIDNYRAAREFDPAYQINVNAGDAIYVRSNSVNFNPTSADASVMVYVEENV